MSDPQMRCSDCLREFVNAERFAVLKEDTTRAYSDEERSFCAHLYEAFVCADCAGWYETPIAVEARPRHERPSSVARSVGALASASDAQEGRHIERTV